MLFQLQTISGGKRKLKCNVCFRRNSITPAERENKEQLCFYSVTIVVCIYLFSQCQWLMCVYNTITAVRKFTFVRRRMETVI